MRNKSMMVALLVLMMVVVSTNAFALGGENCPVHGFFNSLGSFLYNALPWNWGNWAGK